MNGATDSYLHRLQNYLSTVDGLTTEADLFLTPPLPPSKGSRGGPVGIPTVATFISQGVGAGQKQSVYGNQAQGSTPIVQVVIRDVDYLSGHEKAISVFRKLGPKIPNDPPGTPDINKQKPEGYRGHILEEAAPLFQGADPDGLFVWVIRFSLSLDYSKTP